MKPAQTANLIPRLLLGERITSFKLMVAATQTTHETKMPMILAIFTAGGERGPCHSAREHHTHAMLLATELCP